MRARILVIEDELLVALDIVQGLEAAELGEIVHAATEQEALEQLRQYGWSAVVADANLNGRSIAPVAELLRQRSIPLAIVTGYESHNLPEAIRNTPVIEKPFSHAELVQAVRSLCQAG